MTPLSFAALFGLIIVAAAPASASAQGDPAGRERPRRPAGFESAPRPEEPAPTGSRLFTPAPFEPESSEEIGGWRRAGALGAAIVPGVALHGAGHWVAGHERTAWRLLGLEGIGALAMVGAIGALAATGADRRTTGPLATITLQGVGLFAMSFLADIYGVAAPDSARGIAPELGALEIDAGAVAVWSPALPTPAHASWGAAWRPGAWRFEGSGLAPIGEGAGLTRFDLVIARRVWGRHAAGAPAREWLDLGGRAGLDWLEPGPTRAIRGDLWAEARFDLARIGPTLRSSFAEFTWGAGLVRRDYESGGAENWGRLPLRLMWGFYVGQGAARNAEIALYYRHRRDTLAGGIKVPGIAAGYAGSAGVRASSWWSDHWGVEAFGEAGSAWVGGAGLQYRYGRPR